MKKECECYNPCKHEEQVKIELSIPFSVYKTLQYRQTENPEISIEDDIIQTLYCEDFFSCDMDDYERYVECKEEDNCIHHHLLDNKE